MNSGVSEERFEKAISQIKETMGIFWIFIVLLPLRDGISWDTVAIMSLAVCFGHNALSKLGSILVDPDKLPELSDRCKKIARDPKRKVEAVKIYREETGQQLRESKIAVEAFIAAESRQASG